MEITLPTAPLPIKKDKCKWGNLNNFSNTSLLLSQAITNSNKIWLLVCPDSEATFIAEQELKFFCKHASTNPEIIAFPGWETLPYDKFSPHKDIISTRLEILYELPKKTNAIIIVSIADLLHKLCPAEFIANNCFIFNINDKFSSIQLKSLSQAGYQKVSLVEEHGQFAVRGSIIDIYPTGAKHPVRIELFDDSIESIRTFSPENQLTIEKISSFRMLPAYEFPVDELGIEQFSTAFKNAFDIKGYKCPIYNQIQQYEIPDGIHYYLPLFFKHTATLFDYLPKDSNIVLFDSIQQKAEAFLEDVKSRYQQLQNDIYRPLVAPKMLTISVDELFSKIANFKSIHISNNELPEKTSNYNFNYHPLPDLHVNHKSSQPFAELINLQAAIGNILIVADNNGRKEVITSLLLKHGIKPTSYNSVIEFTKKPVAFGICIGELESGVHLTKNKLAIIPESLLFGKKALQKRRQKRTTETIDSAVRSLTELNIGDLVIHQDYGLGKYTGLKTINISNNLSEFVVVAYMNDQTLYVPITNLQILERYSGLDTSAVQLNSLGNDKWKKARKKAASKALDIAAELLDIYSKRSASSGYNYQLTDEYTKFADEFPFEETIDQQRAITDILADLTATTPMDRLVCGDVGFGKTEVAMRAAFIAAYEGKQVAVLVPTTLLAGQHYDTFQDRFSQWPLKIGVVSRFNSKKEEQLVKSQLASGELDIIIGTHKILQKSISFNDLGLLIIDEEHRFGVKDKEKIKALRANIDILALTATPIPRSLNMAMAKVRDLSILATPPSKRLSINTFVAEHEDNLIKDAILRELLRGGQVYYLHNDVSSIDKVAERLRDLVPNALIDVAHGQMRESKLEQVMYNFYHRKFNVLVCTTIIETGIDIPTANTIIINRADKLGLAQLHQLRGRVGRSHHQAYAYLLRPDVKLISANSRKRLDAIAKHQDLGAGFNLASNDLEIRGAGDLLGKEQSGHIQSIGFSLYNELIHRAVDSLNDGAKYDINNPLNTSMDINLGMPALFPDNYIHDIHTRLMFYKQLSQAEDDTQIAKIRYEITDRFGKLPEYADNLFSTMSIKLVATGLGVNKLHAEAKSIIVGFTEKPNIDVNILMDLIHKNVNYQLSGINTLKYIHNATTNNDRLHSVQQLLAQLSKK